MDLVTGDERVSTGEICDVALALKVSRNLTVSSRAISKPWQGNCLRLQLQRLKLWSSATEKDSLGLIQKNHTVIYIYIQDISYISISETVMDNQCRTNHPWGFASSLRVKWLDLVAQDVTQGHKPSLCNESRMETFCKTLLCQLHELSNEHHTATHASRDKIDLCIVQRPQFTCTLFSCACRITNNAHLCHAGSSA